MIETNEGIILLICLMSYIFGFIAGLYTKKGIINDEK